MAKNRIKELRKAQKMTLNNLVDLLAKKGIKVNESQLSKFEKGTSSPRNEETWEALAEILDVTPPYLRGYDEDILNAFDFPVDEINEMIKENVEIKLMLGILYQLKRPERISDIASLAGYAGELSEESWDYIKKSALSIACLERNGVEDWEGFFAKDTSYTKIQ
jgi:transcriptional regulator with XRE-family HTH domain